MHINPCLFIISRKGSNSQSASTDWASEPVVLMAKSLGFVVLTPNHALVVDLIVKTENSVGVKRLEKHECG